MILLLKQIYPFESTLPGQMNSSYAKRPHSCNRKYQALQCIYDITVSYCEHGETMSLQTGKCIAVTDACDYNGFLNTSSSCSPDQVMCLKTGTCVYK
jgi:hypothetical protein